MSTRVDARRTGGRLVEDHLGLWRTRNDWVVASFWSDDKGGTGAVRPLLRSSRPLRSVTYFPYPDANIGWVGLVQEGGPSTVLLMSFQWQHHGWFP